MSKLKLMFLLFGVSVMGMLFITMYWIKPLISGRNEKWKLFSKIMQTAENESFGSEIKHQANSSIKLLMTSSTEKLNFNMCHNSEGQEQESDVFPSNRVVIIGVSSFLGYHAAIYLQATCDVMAIEDSINLHDIDDLAWERWKSLLDKNLSPKYTNMSDEAQLTETLLKYNPSMIVFVPSPIFNGYHDGDKPLSFRRSHLSALLSNFVKLLQVVSANFRQSRIVLFSLSDIAVYSFQKSWLKCFEVSLSAFGDLYRLRTSIIKVDRVGGDLHDHTSTMRCYHVEESMKILHYLMKDQAQCIEHKLEGPCSHFEEENPANPGKNVLMTTYFTGIIDPQHPYFFLPNSYLLLTPYLKGIIRENLHVVIFHNELSEEFQKTVKEHYENIEFVKSDASGRTPNDKRFFLYYDYLLSNPTINQVVMTDMRDVEFFNNPFPMMSAMGDQLYVGLDLPWFADASSQGYVYSVMKMCYGGAEAASFAAKSHPFINAGVLGGTRHTVLSALHKVIEYLNKTHKKANCNMGATNIVYHRYFGDKVYGGYPIQSGFNAYMPGPHGIAIKHKAKPGWT